ncbi:uncharacterized protein G2W53_020222 [Senna tora]|uniref:DUF3741 domain-containing protein n=1 Tax=Senna tora TaxID=362788 RepID=A0A834TVJ1_9FABA|nr:uncharacterized protein G2W53_020222 [Senna tora]
MGGLLRIFEFNQGSMAKKVHARKRQHPGGLETPRNSLELQVEASQIHCFWEITSHVLDLYYSQAEDLSENNCYSDAASMKKLINDELSKRPSTKQNAPSIVARLMGIDMMPLDTKTVLSSDEKKSEKMGKKSSEKEVNGRGSGGRSSSNTNSSIYREFDSCHQHRDDDDDGWNQYLGNPKPREHPQEEELQKFKKEFEAFQAARLMECSKVVEGGNISRRLIAQESLNKEKMEHHASSQRLATELPKISGSDNCHGDMMELFPSKRKESFPSRSRTLSRDFEESLMLKSKSRLDRSSSPTRIVILKPGPDRIYHHDENWISSSGTLQGRNSIEDFLEEVRERLKCELHGKTLKKGSVVRGSGIETPYNEKPSDPKQIARHIAKQVRESVTRDVGANLLRSESTRSYRSEIQFNGPSSPEFINRDTRRFLSERLRNVLKSETHLDIPEVTCGNSRSYVLDDHIVRLKHASYSMNANDLSHWEISKEEKEMQTGSFRREPDDNILLPRELSPRNLVRSLSAPVSGTSFGKLLLEDRHILTGAQIRRKLEAIETVSVDVKKKKKDRFNIKEKVSNFKYSLVLRGKLFGRKFQPMLKSNGNEYGPKVRDVTSGPTENSTEVPPSPASVCSSAQEDSDQACLYMISWCLPISLDMSNHAEISFSSLVAVGGNYSEARPFFRLLMRPERMGGINMNDRNGDASVAHGGGSATSFISSTSKRSIRSLSCLNCLWVGYFASWFTRRWETSLMKYKNRCKLMVNFSISNAKYTYVHDQKYPLEAVDIHHIVVFCFKCLLLDIVLVKLLLWKPIAKGRTYGALKESVVIMPAFGVQLETHYRSGKVIRCFVPIDKILKPVLLECVTPVTCYWTLSLIVRGESELVLIFKCRSDPDR